MMNRSSILRLSGILAAVAFALSFLVSAFFSLGGFTLLHQFGMDGRVLSQISLGAHLPIGVLLAAAFGILLQDRENRVAGLIGIVQACVGCIITFTGLIGASWVYNDNMLCGPLVHFALAVMYFLSLVLIKNNVSRALRVWAVVAAAYGLVCQLAWQGVEVYRRWYSVTIDGMQTIYAVVSFFTTLPSLMCIAVLTVYFIAQARTSDRCQASCDDGAYLPPQQ